MKLLRRNWSAQEPLSVSLICSLSRFLSFLRLWIYEYWSWHPENIEFFSKKIFIFLLPLLILQNFCCYNWYRYPYNNALHHHVESIILSCLETKSDAMVDHLLRDCDFIGKILQTDKNPIISGDINQVDGCWSFMFCNLKSKLMRNLHKFVIWVKFSLSSLNMAFSFFSRFFWVIDKSIYPCAANCSCCWKAGTTGRKPWSHYANF